MVRECAGQWEETTDEGTHGQSHVRPVKHTPGSIQETKGEPYNLMCTKQINSERWEYYNGDNGVKVNNYAILDNVEQKGSHPFDMKKTGGFEDR